MTVLQETRAALTDGVLVVVDSGRLLVRHFPALLTVFLLGLAGRNAAMWVAVVVGRDHVVLASLLVPLAPLSMVIAFVVMLRIAGGALTGDDGSLSASRRLALLTSALVPFLTVYALTGELTNDRNQFLNESYADEQQNTVFDPSTGIADRSIATVDHLQLIMVVVFLAIRFVIDRLDLEERHTAWGLVQALVEVTWLTWLATYITRQWGSVKDWFGEPRGRDLGQGRGRSVTATDWARGRPRSARWVTCSPTPSTGSGNDRGDTPGLARRGNGGDRRRSAAEPPRPARDAGDGTAVP